MKGYIINGLCYIFPQEVAEIPAVEADVFYVQQENFAAWVAANESVANKIVKYNYNLMTVNPKEWADHLDDELEPPVHDYSHDYLTFTALEDTTFTFSTNALQYSTDDGANWITLEADTATPTVTAGNKILWKQTGLTPTSSAGIGKFSATGNFEASGNIMSLYYGDDFIGQNDLTGKNYAFYRLFRNNTKLINAENLILPATTLAASCYSYMFTNCTSLTTAPELPATTLAERCYDGMFSDCTALTTAPELHATTLANYCYQFMFQGCTALTTAPELPATTLAERCYYCMFSGCTALTTAPELHATTLETGCYQSMFTNCTSLTTAPELPATILTTQCYDTMFGSCTSLVTAPELHATSLADYCYSSMFSDCTALTTAPELPVTTLAEGCYSSMFTGCSSLTTAPELPATTLAEGCYSYMFHGCTSLTTAPELPATTLADECYGNMFNGCTVLNYIKCLATDISALDCTMYWVDDVAPTGTFVKDASMTDWTTGDNGIPLGWTVEDAAA